MFAIDTNLLVYAHNVDAPLHAKAKTFINDVMSKRDAQGQLSVCIPAQVFVEFLNVITWQKMSTPLSLADAREVVQDYLDTGVTVVHPQPTQLDTFLTLLKSTTSRKRIFDTALAATLKDNNIQGIYTVNVNDFKMFNFLDVKNPLVP